MSREWITFEVEVSAEVDGPDAEQALRELIGEHLNRLTAALHGQQPLVSMRGPTHRAALDGE